MASAGEITVDVVPRFVTDPEHTESLRALLARHNRSICDHGPDCLDCTPDFSTLILAAVLDGNDRLERMEQLLMTQATQIQTIADSISALGDEIGSIDDAVQSFASEHPDVDLSPITNAVASAKAKADQALSDAQNAASAPAPVVSDPSAPVDGPAPVPDPQPAEETDNILIGDQADSDSATSA